MNIELMILLGLNCNFRCSHCLNDSHPGFTKFDISPSEIDSIVSEIRKHDGISAIGFSGGEPLLYLEQIEQIVSNVGKLQPTRQIRFSVTTNGSLIERFSDRLQKLNIATALISYDKPHSEFLNLEKLEKNLLAAKNVFKTVELTTTYDKSPTENKLYEIAMRHNVLVNFSRVIKSGRHQSFDVMNDSKYECVNCPNLTLEKSDRLKITFLPSVGYSFCCGPLLFDSHSDINEVAFSSIGNLLESKGLRLQRRMTQIKLPKKSANDCENCVLALKNKTFKKLERFITSESSWKNTISSTELTPTELLEASEYFNVRRISKSKNDSFAFKTPDEIPGLDVHSGSSLTKLEISEFSDFTIESFYKIHMEKYSQKDIETFREQQDVFFNFPYKFIRHSKNGKIISYLVVAKLQKHPLNEQTAWHVGYWGIDSSETNRVVRSAIKNDWKKCLSELNNEAPVIAVVDEDNPPAIRMAQSFGMDVSTLRFDVKDLT